MGLQVVFFFFFFFFKSEFLSRGAFNVVQGRSHSSLRFMLRLVLVMDWAQWCLWLPLWVYSNVVVVWWS
jgi:hypothetical protein